MEQDGRSGPAVGVVAVIWRSNRVLLVQRDKTPYRGCWALPGGSVLRGETIPAATLRELREETGLAGSEASPFTAFDVFARTEQGEPGHHFVLIASLVPDPGGEAVAAEDACDVGWFAADALPDPQVPDLAQVVRLSRLARVARQIG